jgi:hypothetical protein
MKVSAMCRGIIEHYFFFKASDCIQPGILMELEYQAVLLFVKCGLF